MLRGGGNDLSVYALPQFSLLFIIIISSLQEVLHGFPIVSLNCSTQRDEGLGENSTQTHERASLFLMPEIPCCNFNYSFNLAFP